jgi:signal transduction histidine kinase
MRLSARLRLTMLYSGVFILFGAALLTVNYRLLVNQLPTSAIVESAPVSSASSPSVSPGGILPPDSLATDAPQPTSAPGVTASANDSIMNSVVTQYRASTVHALQRNSVLTLLVGVVLAAAIVWLTTRRVLAPLQRMSDTARRVTQNNLSERIPLSGPRDELFTLAQTFNETLDRLEGAFAHERRLIANTSHELRTPVANQRTLLEVTLADPDATALALREACVTSLDQAHRMESIIESMLALSNAQHDPRIRSAFRLDELASLVLAESDLRELRLSADLEPVTITADELYCRLALANLIGNAARHNIDAGWVSVIVRRRSNVAELIVSNSASTMDAQVLDRLREPFRRVGAPRTGSDRGAGLGLSIVDTIAAVQGWTLELAVPTDGTFQATLYIPASP